MKEINHQGFCYHDGNSSDKNIKEISSAAIETIGQERINKEEQLLLTISRNIKKNA